MYWYKYINIDLNLSRVERNNKLHKEAFSLLEKNLIEKFHFKKEDLKYKYGRKGKPYLEKSPLNFSISHCNEVVVCSVNKMKIGIDIEDIKNINKYVISKTLTEVERKNMEFSNRRDEYFFRLWTLKEAFIKCIGQGLSYGMRNVEFKISDNDTNILCNINGFNFKQEKVVIKDKESIISIAWGACNE